MYSFVTDDKRLHSFRDSSFTNVPCLYSIWKLPTNDVKNFTKNERIDGETVPHEVLILVSGDPHSCIAGFSLGWPLSVVWSAPITEMHRTLCVYFLGIVTQHDIT